jgi:hypothetical protein
MKKGLTIIVFNVILLLSLAACKDDNVKTPGEKMSDVIASRMTDKKATYTGEVYILTASGFSKEFSGVTYKLKGQYVVFTLNDSSGYLQDFVFNMDKLLSFTQSGTSFSFYFE